MLKKQNLTHPRAAMLATLPRFEIVMTDSHKRQIILCEPNAGKSYFTWLYKQSIQMCCGTCGYIITQVLCKLCNFNLCEF